jgi:hypothetical protein
MSFAIGFVVGAICFGILYRGYKILKDRNAFDFEDPEELLEDENEEDDAV